MRYRQLYYDGCNGWCLGDVLEAEPNKKGVVDLFDPEEDDEDDRECFRYSSRNNDGLLENEGGEELLVPLSTPPTKGAKLVCVQLETCDDNTDGVAFYGYFEGKPARKDLRAAVKACEKVPGPLGPADWTGPSDWKEEPNRLSEATGLKRWYVSAAC